MKKPIEGFINERTIVITSLKLKRNYAQHQPVTYFFEMMKRLHAM